MFLMLFTGQIVHEKNPSADHLFWASICAVPFVTIWNFSAAKYWTFRTSNTAASTPDSAPSLAQSS
jgi:hypothetical protein